MATEKNNNYADIFLLHLNKYAKRPVYEISLPIALVQCLMGKQISNSGPLINCRV